MIRTSEDISELAKALAVAQGKITDAQRDNTADTGKFKYKYADLAQCLQIGRPVLSENGLSIVQFPGSTESGDMKLTTRLMHDSGQWIEDDFDMPITIPLNKEGREMNPPAQAAGIVITYMRRYAYTSVLGISQEDTDAAQGEHGGTTYRKQEPVDDKPWYNNVGADKDGIIGAMIGGKTADTIVKELRENWKVSKKTVDIIEQFAHEARNTG